MRIGIPKEVKVKENRISCTPGGVRELVQAGHDVLVEQGAGVGSARVVVCGIGTASVGCRKGVFGVLATKIEGKSPKLTRSRNTLPISARASLGPGMVVWTLGR